MKLNRGPWVSYIIVIATILVISAIVLTFCLIGKSSDENEQKYALNSAWGWRCEEGYCKKTLVTNETAHSIKSLQACQLGCSDWGSLWPRPTGDVSLSTDLVKINVNSIDSEVPYDNTPTADLLRRSFKLFKEQIMATLPRNHMTSGGKSLFIKFELKDTATANLTLTTDESYALKVEETSDGRIIGTISAQTFFGARHALQTLNQLIVFDDLRDQVIMPKQVFITDSPAYPYRGILLDTARSYIDVDSIKRTLDGMGASKLNFFHWHITDSHSFPFVSKSRPNLSKYGAYSPTKIYSESDIKEIINYGLERGVRILPEFDAPAHVGEGWQVTGLVTCLNKQPWQQYCVEPPCGQLDPTKDELYPFLEGIYQDMFDLFQRDLFHMGGDEVNFNCWNTTDSIVEWMNQNGLGTTEADFVKLWDRFQSRALDLVYKKAGGTIPVIMWTSTLTHKEYLLTYLPKDKYIVQIWTLGNDSQVQNLLENGYKIILSNYDALYLDCGFAAWVTDGHNWCSPYVGWQKVYENTPVKIAGEKKNQVLGSEATLWTEQVDSAAVDSRLWPRAAAMAEVLWSEPKSGWAEAEDRFLTHRERLVRLGVKADSIEPEWCLHNKEQCRINAKFNQ